MKPVQVAIIGLGYWGPNLLRNFAKLPGVTVRFGCDLRPEILAKFTKEYPSVTFTANMDEVFASDEVDAVVIATPMHTHAEIALKAFAAGKHVLTEKPLAGSVSDAEAMIAAAKKADRILMVDHTFVYEPAVEWIAKQVAEGAIGKFLYFDSTRINLGLLQPTHNVLWDLAVHDLAILGELVDLSTVTEVAAFGQKHHTKEEEIAHLHLKFKNGVGAHIAVSWLSPVKIRSTLIGGTEKMIAYNDNEPSEKVRLYDKGVTVTREDQSFALPVYRSGDVLIPRLVTKEPLGELAKHFAACVRGEEKPRTPGEKALPIVRILEEATTMMRSHS